MISCINFRKNPEEITVKKKQNRITALSNSKGRFRKVWETFKRQNGQFLEKSKQDQSKKVKSSQNIGILIRLRQ